MSQENETNESKKMSDSIGKLAEALSKAQGAMASASKDASNPFFKSTYASLASIWDCVRKPLADNQLSVIQTTSKSVNSITINTLLVHASGEWIGGELNMTPTKNDPQGIGSAITYARRYALSAIVGVSTEDDDAEASMNRASKQPQSTNAEKRDFAKEVLDSFFALETRLSDQYGADAYREFVKNSQGKSPELQQIKEWSSPKQIAWLRNVNAAIQEHLKKGEAA